MAAGAFLPLAAFVLISGGVGYKLTRLWLRTGGVPEASLGLGLLVLTVSMPISAVGRIPAVAMQPTGRLCFALGLTLCAVGLSGLVYFNRFVFRRDARWAGWFTSIVSVLLFGSVFAISAANFRGESVEAIKDAMRPATLTLMATLMVCFAWATFESLRSARAARRRMRLGLSDRVAVDRFVVWGVGNLASAVLLGVLTWCVMAGMVILREPLPLACIAASGIVMSTCWSFTFFAPASYVRWATRAAPE